MFCTCDSSRRVKEVRGGEKRAGEKTERNAHKMRSVLCGVSLQGESENERDERYLLPFHQPPCHSASNRASAAIESSAASIHTPMSLETTHFVG